MATGFADFIMKLFEGKGGDVNDLKAPQLRRIGWLIAIGIIGALILAIGFSPRLQSPSQTPANPPRRIIEDARAVAAGSGGGLDSDEARLERNLAEILSQVKGAGRVTVKVSFSTGRAYDYAENATREESTTRERDSGGVTRETTEVRTSGEVVTAQEKAGGLAVPVVRSVMEPRVQGVLVVSEGAGDPRVKGALTDAVTTLLDIPPHKVAVLPRER